MKSTGLLLAALATFVPFAAPLPTEDPSSPNVEKRQGSSWFLPNLDHTSGPVRGFVPDLVDGNGNADFNYPVWKSVNSGDSQGFINALYSDGPTGSRDNLWLAGQPRVVYLAPGTYTLSSTIFFDTDTVIIGDANNPPTIKAAANFHGPYLLGGGEGGDPNQGHGELHFSVMMKNVILDTTANTANSQFIALSWRVAQNSALVNVQINMPQGAHTGISMGQGSTISVGDVTFNFGNVGFHFDGHQQAQLKNMKFNSCTTGILIDNGFVVEIFAPTCTTVGNCIVFNSGGAWVSVVDGISRNSGTFFRSNVQFPNFLVENISKDTTNSDMINVNGATKVGGVTSIGSYIYGNTYGKTPVYQNNPTAQNVNRPSALAPNGRFPVSTAPQYQGKTMSDVINLKDANQNGGFQLHGDGSIDDTAALQGALNTAASRGKIAYLPFGIYKVTNTVTLPPGTELYGEAWSTISGYGGSFSDESNPRAVVQVGQPNSRGTAHIQDLRFTVGEQLPGAVILRINMAGNAPGDVAVYNSLITVGGTRDTSISCTDESGCRGALLGLHLAAGSSAYIDNFWAWVADHATDPSDNRPSRSIRIAGKGGVLIEATAGTWLSGVGSEHWWLYNLHYHNAQNVFTSLFQSETNYHQGTAGSTVPPAPFTPTSSDPNFSWCNGDRQCAMTIAQYFTGSSAIYTYAGASWNFFGGDQQNMNVLGTTVANSHLHGFTDHQATYAVRLPSGKQFGNGGNDGFGGSWNSLVADIAAQV